MPQSPWPAFALWPWGRLAALLAGCWLTLCGVFARLEPDVILWRSFLGAVAVGVAAGVAHRIILVVR